ncbi:MAG: aminoglycoside phosphotransferase family protein [Acidimicrobiales bacterium]|nr:aminoglycoside phosphotransferase family protein [Acidimicrobiales bacterium]
MRTRDRFDAGAAAAFLRERFADPAITVEPLSGGNWSDAFAFRHEGADLVARFGRHPEDYRKDARAADWRSPALPVPAFVDLGPVDGGAVDPGTAAGLDDPAGWWFAVTMRAHGTPLETASPAGWPALIPEVVDLIATAAALPYDADLGVGRWDGDGVAPHATWRSFLLEVTEDGPGHRIAGWSTALAAHPEAQAAFDAGVATLARLADAIDPPVGVVHADLTNANVLVDRGRITAVLDWGSALYGDPLHEVAWLTYWQPWQPAVPGAALLAAALADGRLTVGGDVDRRLHACRLHIGLGHLGYHAWNGDDVWLDRLTRLVLADVDPR